VITVKNANFVSAISKTVMIVYIIENEKWDNKTKQKSTNKQQ